MGIAAKTQLTADFLRRKLVEYENLKSEIEELRVLVAADEGQDVGA